MGIPKFEITFVDQEIPLTPFKFSAYSIAEAYRIVDYVERELKEFGQRVSFRINNYPHEGSIFHDGNNEIATLSRSMGLQDTRSSYH